MTHATKQKRGCLRKLLRFTVWSVSILFVLVTGFIIYYKYATRITPPSVSDKSALEWKRDSLGPQFYQVKNNWLRKSRSGLWEMYLEGNAFERGAAAGNMEKELLYEQEVAFFGKLQEMVPDRSYIKFLKYFIAWFNRNLDKHVPIEYQLEIYGESFFGPEEFNFIGKNYDRMLNYHSAHDMGHALANANMVGCTSFSVKDSASYNGKLLLGRNLDFNMGDAFAKNKMILFMNPDSGYKHAFVTWPGFLGVVSGMNIHGLTVTLNAAPSELPFASKTPISILAREILQYARNIDDAIAIATRRQTFVSELLMIGSAEDHQTVIIEKSPSKMEVYRPSGNVLTCSNHYQSNSLLALNDKQFETTSTLYRKSRIDTLVKRNLPLNPADVATILRDQKGINDVNIGMGNEDAINQLMAHHGVIFSPEEHTIWVSCNPYQLGAFICYNLDSVFALSDEVPVTGREVYDTAASIPADDFLNSPKYVNWQAYKVQSSFLKTVIKSRSKYIFSHEQKNAFLHLNPEYYEGYYLVGEYLVLLEDYAGSIEMFQAALKKDIPLKPERDKIEKRIQWVQKKSKQ